MQKIRVRSLFRGGLVPALMLATLLLGCQADLKSQRLPQLTYGYLPPLTLKVGAIKTVVEYRPPLTAPNVDHLFPTPPLKALRRWAGDRLKAGGGGGVARFVITDASVIETALPVKKGLAGAFTKEQTERYQARIKATLEIRGGDGAKLAFAEADVERSTTIREDASVNERELVWFKLTEALMNDFNAEMEKNIRRYMRKWLAS